MKSNSAQPFRLPVIQLVLPNDCPCSWATNAACAVLAARDAIVTSASPKQRTDSDVERTDETRTVLNLCIPYSPNPHDTVGSLHPYLREDIKRPVDIQALFYKGCTATPPPISSPRAEISTFPDCQRKSYRAR